ncbi:MAG: group 1 truncated hemoglobin [Flavobacteriales bacterium]
MKQKILFLAMLSGVLLISSCKKDEEEPAATAPTETPTLYTRLGGIEAITAVTDQFLANVVADPVVNGSFSATVADPYRTQLLRFNLIDQICAASGGPCQYKGKTMLEAHQGMNITQEQFDALVGDLVAALDQFSVPAQEKNELLTILGSLQPDIVGV